MDGLNNKAQTQTLNDGKIITPTSDQRPAQFKLHMDLGA